ncbi:MAG: response regulator transcription factor [Bacteriovoracaceae bacterium]|nr:response regulator transcription factor [Bacteriovoracaceae bacterium]
MPNLLYIDNDTNSLKFYQDILKPHITVETCEKPDEMLGMAKNNRFDAIMLEVNLSNACSFELFKTLRTYSNTREIPIFFISNDNNTNFLLKAFALGTADYILRDMVPDEVLARIHSRLKKAGKETLSFGDIIINQDSLIVYCQKKLIELTQIEYKILLFFTRRTLNGRRKIFNLNEIIEFVWPLNSQNVLPSTLSTHITNLRKKLNSKEVEFSSIRNEGYYLKIRN